MLVANSEILENFRAKRPCPQVHFMVKRFRPKVHLGTKKKRVGTGQRFRKK